MAIEYIALIPAYEPDDKLAGVVGDLKEKGFDIVIVDDGSGPDHAELFSRVSDDATVLTHKTNKGKGAALRTGLEHIYRYRSHAWLNPKLIICYSKQSYEVGGSK